jgi:hypothetical protein
MLTAGFCDVGASMFNACAGKSKNLWFFCTDVSELPIVRLKDIIGNVLLKIDGITMGCVRKE